MVGKREFSVGDLLMYRQYNLKEASKEYKLFVVSSYGSISTTISAPPTSGTSGTSDTSKANKSYVQILEFVTHDDISFRLWTRAFESATKYFA